MKYTSKHYAEALMAAIETEPNVSVLAKQLAAVLHKHKALGLKDEIIERWQRLMNEKNGVRTITVSSAAPLSEHHKKLVAELVGPHLDATYIIDQKLLAGMTIMVDDRYFIDGSGRSRIQAFLEPKRHE